MKTLFERLSKENQEKINNIGNSILKSTILNALEKEYFTSLTIKEVILLFASLDSEANLYELRQLFNNN